VAINTRTLEWSPESEAQYQAQKANTHSELIGRLQSQLAMDNAAANANYNDLATRALAEKMFGSYSAMNTDGAEGDYEDNLIAQLKNQFSGWDKDYEGRETASLSNTTIPAKTAKIMEELGEDGKIIDRYGGEFQGDYEPETATDAVNAAVTAGVNEKKAEVQQVQAQQDAMQKLQQMLGGSMLSSDDVYNRDYQAYRNAGASDRQARKWAAQNAGQYRLQRISNLNNAFSNLGLNNDGSINGMGVNIINMMGREDAYQAGLLGNGRPGLKEQWAIDQQRKMADEAFMRNLYLKQLDQDYRMALREMGGGGRSGGSTAGESGGVRGPSVDSNILKAAKDYIKHWREIHKDDGDDAWKTDARYLQALSVVDSNADNLFPSYDLDTDTGFVSAITAMREGRNPKGTIYSPEAIDRFIDDQVSTDTEDGQAMNTYLKQYNHSIGG